MVRTFTYLLVGFICCSLTSLYSQEDWQTIELCPKTIRTTQEFTTKNNCGGLTSQYRTIPAGSTLELFRTVRRNMGRFNGNQWYGCFCDYKLPAESNMKFDCETDEALTSDLDVLYSYVLNYFWLDTGSDFDENDCTDFSSSYGFGGWTQRQIGPLFDDPSLFGRREDVNVYKHPDLQAAFAYRSYVNFSFEYLTEQGTPGWEIILERSVTEECTVPLTIRTYDANPEFLNTGFLGTNEDVDHITELTDPATALLSVTEQRDRVLADSVSEILLAIPYAEAVETSEWVLPEDHGSIRTPWGTGTAEIEGQDYFLALYQAPADLPGGEATKQIEGIDAAEAEIAVTFTGSTGEMTQSFSIDVLRPPVILVHGTFDNPENCWQTPLAGLNSMADTLGNSGFKVFLVDYQESNGRTDRGPSTFEDNKNVVYENPGGIKDAIAWFREELDCAATRADVIGHSMGGVLPRVYASSRGPGIRSYETNYYRRDNFFRGDIHRMISIASTHHGSNLSGFLHFVEETTLTTDLPFIEAFVNGSSILAAWLGGLGSSGAVRSQFPRSLALQRIGPTPVPSHAVVCTIEDVNDISANIGDESVLLTYANFLRALTMVFYFNKATLREFNTNMLYQYSRLPDRLRNQHTVPPPFTPIAKEAVLDATKPMNREAFIDSLELEVGRAWFLWHLLSDDVDDDWISVEKAYVTPYETTEINYGDFDDPLQTALQNEQWDIIRGEREITLDIEPATADKLVNFFRQLIFENDANDCVVRFESQTGSLREPFYQVFDDHIHSFAPRYADVQEHVIQVLKSGYDRFDTGGFPNAGRLLPISFPDPDEIGPLRSLDDLGDALVTGREAICWSGIVCDHAYAIAEVAQNERVVILGRPVNPDATVLIQDDNATKPMNLKGKSSNWGPQRGFIAEDQQFSKLWFQYEDDDTEERDEDIEKYNEEVEKTMADPTVPSLLAQLTKPYTCDGVLDTFAVYYDTTITDATLAIVLSTDGETFYPYSYDMHEACNGPSTECCPIFNQTRSAENLVPLRVLANAELRDEQGNPRFYTADYDLLAIGFYDKALHGNENDDYPESVPAFTGDDFDAERGFITERQKGLVDLINEAVEDSGYRGGNVTHHGPENQYYILGRPDKGSPYVDYPIVAFEPDPLGTRGIIRAIPKGPAGFRDRYLKQYFAKMRRKGYDLYPNQVAIGWRWDQERPYTYEDGWDDRDAPGLDAGPEQIPRERDIPCSCFQEPESQLVDERFGLPETPTVRKNARVFPNPARRVLNLEIAADRDQSAQFRLIDYSGRLVHRGRLILNRGLHVYQLPLPDLPAGLYQLTVQSGTRVLSQKISIINAN